MTGGGEVGATPWRSMREIIGANERVAVPVVIVRRKCLAIRGQPTDGSAVVTRGEELTASSGDDCRGSASLLHREDPVALSVPHGNGVAIVFDVIQLARLPDRALWKMHVGVQYRHE